MNTSEFVMTFLGLVGVSAAWVGAGVWWHRREEAAREQRAEAEAAADTAAMAELERTRPHLVAAVRAMELGPGYDPSPAYRVTSAGPWVRPGGPEEAARCPGCGATQGISLVWVEAREELARFVCSVDAVTWVDPGWANDDAIAWVVRQPRDATWFTGPEEGPPATVELVERMRREAGNS